MTVDVAPSRQQLQERRFGFHCLLHPPHGAFGVLAFGEPALNGKIQFSGLYAAKHRHSRGPSGGRKSFFTEFIDKK